MHFGSVWSLHGMVGNPLESQYLPGTPGDSWVRGDTKGTEAEVAAREEQGRGRFHTASEATVAMGCRLGSVRFRKSASQNRRQNEEWGEGQGALERARLAAGGGGTAGDLRARAKPGKHQHTHTHTFSLARSMVRVQP